MDKPIIARREVTNHILHTFKLKADKRLGQNFLIDEEVVRRIVAAAELSEDDTVLEVGPGIGRNCKINRCRLVQVCLLCKG